MQLAIYSDRFRLAPEGLLGGEPGQRGYCRIFRADGTVEELKSKAAVDLARGDVVEIFVGGGGGFGRISERPDAMIDRDLADRLHTRSAGPAQAGGGVAALGDLLLQLGSSDQPQTPASATELRLALKLSECAVEHIRGLLDGDRLTSS